MKKKPLENNIKDMTIQCDSLTSRHKMTEVRLTLRSIRYYPFFFFFFQFKKAVQIFVCANEKIFMCVSFNTKMISILMPTFKS